jgi:hypothetical protein
MGLLARLGVAPILGFFAGHGKKAGRAPIAPNMAPMLDSEAMCAPARKKFDTSRSLPLPGSLALLLRR